MKYTLEKAEEEKQEIIQDLKNDLLNIDKLLDRERSLDRRVLLMSFHEILSMTLKSVRATKLNTNKEAK